MFPNELPRFIGDNIMQRTETYRTYYSENPVMSGLKRIGYTLAYFVCTLHKCVEASKLAQRNPNDKEAIFRALS